MSEGFTVLLDTSVVIDIEEIDGQDVAAKVGCDLADLRPGISSLTLAELTAGPYATSDPTTKQARQVRLQWVEATFDPLPFDEVAARSYGLIYAQVLSQGRKPRKRMVDMLIASVAAANRLPLLTRNTDDFAGLEDVVTVIDV